MEHEIIIKEFTFLSRSYRVKVHCNPKLIEMEVFVYNSWWREVLTSKVGRWKRIYFGHDNPIMAMIDFYKQNIK